MSHRITIPAGERLSRKHRFTLQFLLGCVQKGKLLLDCQSVGAEDKT